MSIGETVRKLKESMAGQKASGTSREIDFSVYAPEAKKVCVAGTFNDWDPNSTPLKPARKGTWKIRIRLASGRYEYKYVIDGMWMQDAPCAESVQNSYGSYNCVIGV